MADFVRIRDHPGDMVRLACTKCERRGQYRKATLIVRYGPEKGAIFAVRREPDIYIGVCQPIQRRVGRPPTGARAEKAVPFPSPPLGSSRLPRTAQFPKPPWVSGLDSGGNRVI
jgi:hypothetical protein